MPNTAVLRGVLKYRADIAPVLLVVCGSALALLPFFVHLPLVALVPLLALVLYVRTFAAFAQHNHAHLPVFNWAPFNALYDVLLAQNTGYPTSLWELHHNRGHHRHFLDPARDVGSIAIAGSDQVMSRSHYALRGNLRIHYDSICIGLEEGRAGRRTLLPKLASETLVQSLLTGLLLWWNWPLALAFVVLPNFLSAYLIWWQSYPHHLELPGTSVYDSSISVEHPVYNLLTFNIGHHTVHHEKPTLHWSLLPARTALVRDRIHPDCFRESHKTVGNSVVASVVSRAKRLYG